MSAISATAIDTAPRLRPVYRELASLVLARLNCIKSGNSTWEARHLNRITEIVRERMPRGSGFDSGTTLDLERSTGDRLVFRTSFHHMDEGGGYDGWTDHTVTVTPSLALEFDVRVSGRDRNDIKDYIAEMFQYALSEQIAIG